MVFGEKLKALRKKSGMSQEKLAEKLSVSRQAVTKLEISAGTPDVENMVAISDLFDVSVDELLSNEKMTKETRDFLFDGVAEYDIDEAKRYDMNFGGAKSVYLAGYKGEKIRIRLTSNTLPTLQRDFNVKIDDIKKRINVDIIRKNGMTEAMAKEAVYIFVQIPTPYLGQIKCAVHSEIVEIRSLECERIELDVKTSSRWQGLSARIRFSTAYRRSIGSRSSSLFPRSPLS